MHQTNGIGLVSYVADDPRASFYWLERGGSILGLEIRTGRQHIEASATKASRAALPKLV